MLLSKCARFSSRILGVHCCRRKAIYSFPYRRLGGVIMRTYVFTERERRIIQGFLSRRIGIADRDLSKIRSRLKLFERLKNDVFLYLELWDTVLLETAESETTASA